MEGIWGGDSLTDLANVSFEQAKQVRPKFHPTLSDSFWTKSLYINQLACFNFRRNDIHTYISIYIYRYIQIYINTYTTRPSSKKRSKKKNRTSFGTRSSTFDPGCRFQSPGKALTRAPKAPCSMEARDNLREYSMQRT